MRKLEKANGKATKGHNAKLAVAIVENLTVLSGEMLTLRKCLQLYRLSQSTGLRSDLVTPVMEGLLQSELLAMETPSLSMFDQTRTLISILTASLRITETEADRSIQLNFLDVVDEQLRET